MLVDAKDMQKALDYIEKHNLSYVFKLTEQYDSKTLTISFVDKMSKDCDIIIHHSDKNLQPDLVIKSKLPKVE